MCVFAFAHNNTPSIVISYTGEEFPVWVKSGSNTVLGSDLTQTAGEFIWVKVEAYSIKITVFGTFALQKRLFFVVGVSVFELCYFGIFGIFKTFIRANSLFCTNYSIISNCIFCSHPLKGNLKGKNMGESMGKNVVHLVLSFDIQYFPRK